MKFLSVAFSCLIALAAHARAGVIYFVSLDTTPLIGHSAGPFSLGFQFSDGSGTNDGNNAVVLSNFAFGAGGATGSPVLIGSAFGDLSSSVTLTDGQAANIFAQSFNAGAILSFNLSITTNLDPGTPDEFIWSILDSSFSPIPSTAGDPLDPFLVIDITSASPTVQVFGGDINRSPAAGGGPIALSDPIVTLGTSPEPSTMVLCALPILGLLARRVWVVRRAGNSSSQSR